MGYPLLVKFVTIYIIYNSIYLMANFIVSPPPDSEAILMTTRVLAGNMYPSKLPPPPLVCAGFPPPPG